MDTYPKIETKRLQLGAWSENDIPKLVEYAGNKKVADNTLNIPHPYTQEDAIFWIKLTQEGFTNQTQYAFSIRIKENNDFIGGVGLKIKSEYDRAELGYWIGEPFWNRGYASEAVG